MPVHPVQSIRKVILFVPLVAVLACGQPVSLTDSEKAGIVDEVREALFQYHSDIRELGLKAEFHYLDSSDEFHWTPPGYAGPISYDSVAAILNQNASSFSMIENSFDTLVIHPLTATYASYTGRLTSKVTDKRGVNSSVSLIETGIMVKRKDRWKLLSGQTSVLSD